MKNRNSISTTILLVLGCFALSPAAQGALDPTDTAYGTGALSNEAGGSHNSAFGYYTLNSNTTGNNNTATGASALSGNTTASSNTATGVAALYSNTTGNNNTATGGFALLLNGGSDNTATGVLALVNNTTGSNNIALGVNAGQNLTTGDNNIDIGNDGAADETNTIRIGTQGTQTNAYIAGIYQTTVPRGLSVVVDSTGHFGTKGSSERLKQEIKPMDKASEAILALQPVTFHYKHELDPEGIPQFGLVAEQVEKVNPDLVARDADGKIYTVRYEAVNAMLLNEFLKEHRKVEEQGATIAELKKEIADLTATVREQAAQIQNISAQVELSNVAPRIVLNNP